MIEEELNSSFLFDLLGFYCYNYRRFEGAFLKNRTEKVKRAYATLRARLKFYKEV